MGGCSSNLSPEEREAMRRSKDIDKLNNDAYKEESEIIKLLLLGAGESGKSTIFKQMKILYGLGFTAEDQKAMTPVCYNNTILAMKCLVENAANLKIDLPAKAVAEEFMNVSDEAEIDAAVGAMIKTLWADSGILACFEERADFQLIDSAKYYFKAIDRLAADDYLASVDDILRSRVRTSGIVEEKYKIDGVDFCMYDVGGQRNERKKWIHCFDNVTAVIFVAAISEYDQVLYEDNSQNRMDEALALFDEICNSRWFVETSMILFLNKVDLFEEKLFKKPIRLSPNPDTGFPGRYLDYEGGDDVEAGKEYFRSKFYVLNRSEDKEIYSHITCATDTSNVQVVFNACKDIILKGNLKGSGFMD